MDEVTAEPEVEPQLARSVADGVLEEKTRRALERHYNHQDGTNISQGGTIWMGGKIWMATKHHPPLRHRPERKRDVYWRPMLPGSSHSPFVGPRCFVVLQQSYPQPPLLHRPKPISTTPPTTAGSWAVSPHRFFQSGTKTELSPNKPAIMIIPGVTLKAQEVVQLL